MSEVQTTYESSDIKALGDIAGIRKRPGMYIGETIQPGHLLVEAFDNARDEMHAGHASKCVVSIDNKEHRYSVRDYGRGIPIGKTEYVDITGDIHKLEALQLLVTKTHSGAKFDEGSYKVSSGINGVGLKCICALSEMMAIETYREGKSVKIVAKQGAIDPPNYLDYSDKGEIPSNGVKIEFVADPEIFDNQTIPKDNIMSMLGIAKAFGLNVELFEDGEEVELPQSGVIDLMHKDNDSVSSYCEHTFKVDSVEKEEFVVAFKYTSETNYISNGFCNYLPNPGGGSHLRFFEDCYRQAWNKYLDDDFKIQDTMLGFRNVVAVFISNQAMSFASQTKERLTTNKSYFEKFRDGIVSGIHEYFDTNEDLRHGLIKRFKEFRAAQNKLLSGKELSSLLYVNENNGDGKSVRRKSVVEKLRECTSKSRDNTELYIVEGDSAAGSVVSARDTVHQALLPIRGKILNVATRGSDPVVVMRNEEIRSIVNSIGAGIGENCDASKSRYERVLILADGDEDGKNISALLISIFVNLMPDLVEKGLVCVVQPPLYGWETKAGFQFTNDRSVIPVNQAFTRYKGLGEMDAIEIYDSCMNIANQDLLKIEYPLNIDHFNEAMTSSSKRFEILDSMGVIQRVGI